MKRIRQPAGLWIRIHFFAYPDPAVFLNADPDPAVFLMRIRIQLKQICEKLPSVEYSGVEKDKQKYSKV